MGASRPPQGREMQAVQFVFLLEQVLNGLLNGALYLMIALGLSLIFSLGGIVNLAHGAFYAIGAYLLVTVADRLGFAAGAVVSPLAVAGLGVIVERFLFRPFYRADPILTLLLTFGLAMVIEQALRMIWGATPIPFSIPTALRGQVFLGDMIYPRYRLFVLAVAAVTVIGIWYLLQRTPFGRVVRAGVQNPDMVGALGISLAPYMTTVAALGIGLAGLAGVLIAPIAGVHPAMGAEIITAAFVVVVIGGLGSFGGVVTAALLVGLAVLPFGLSAIGLTLTSSIDVVVFAIAAMALNILVGYTGLVSFGHGTWFGVAAYAAALAQRNWLPGQIVLPTLFALVFVLVASFAVGLLILRRRGVYFSLLTLALTALLYTVAFRWTALTGGENGLGGIVRERLLGLDVSGNAAFYAVTAAVALLVTYALARFHRSPV